MLNRPEVTDNLIMQINDVITEHPDWQSAYEFNSHPNLKQSISPGKAAVLTLPDNWRKLLPSDKKEVMLGLRPENIFIDCERPIRKPYIRIKLSWIEVLGKEILYYLENDMGLEIAALSLIEHKIIPGDILYASFSWTDAYFFDSDTGLSFGYPKEFNLSKGVVFDEFSEQYFNKHIVCSKL